jgi:amino acid transporter
MLAPKEQAAERTVVEPRGPTTSERGLKSGALGVVSATVIGVASVGPAYSLAATLGLTAAVLGVFSPAIVVVSFIPMLFAAAAYFYLNRVDPDCGATFPWVTRAMGPHAGWMGGWGVVIADIVVMPSLAWVAAWYTYALFGLDSLAANSWAVMGLGCAYILVMTTITWLGIEISARTQFVLLTTEIVILLGFSIYALARVFTSQPAGSITPSWDWINPFNLTSSQLAQGILLTLFIYWGWDTAANVNEETRKGRTAAGVATVTSTIILVLTYVVVAFAATAYRGPGFLVDNPDDVLTGMVGSPWDKIMILAILTSAIACTQTTILPTARTTLSMAAHGAMPRWLGTISPRFLTPTGSTWAMGIASIAMYVVLMLIDSSENLLWDAIAGLGFAVAFYYGITALASPILFRRVLTKSWKHFLLAGVVPMIAAMVLFWVFVRSAIDLWNPKNSYTPAWFAFGDFQGVGPALVIGIGMLLVGVPLMFLFQAGHPTFFRRKPEVATSIDGLLPDPDRVTDEGLDLGEFRLPAEREGSLETKGSAPEDHEPPERAHLGDPRGRA